MNSGKFQLFFDTLKRYQQLPAEQACSLPADFYVNEAFLQFEVEQLLCKEWLCLGRVDELPQPGDYFTTELLGEPLLIVRGDDHVIRVLANVCRHRNMLVAEGVGNAKSFSCPYHAWTYARNGQLLRAPRMSLSESELAECRLPELRSAIWRGFLFVNLDGNAEALLPRLAGFEPIIENYRTEEMQHVFVQEEIWQTNWKCLVENFMEGYHLSVVHPKTLHPITPTRLCEKFSNGIGFTGYKAYYPDSVSGREPFASTLTEQERRCSTLFCIYPGLVASQSPNLLVYLSLQPDTADRVKVRWGAAIYNRNEVAVDRVEQLLELWKSVNAEDHEQLAKLQRGLKSRNTGVGRLAPGALEGTIWDFYQYYAHQLLHSHDLDGQ